jgi:hypothetical protein
MDIHKPKPIHNLREFLKEVGIIVLGVSIALAAEQAVEWFHWRAQVREARSIIATEMASNLAAAAERIGAQACIDSRLDELGRILDQASRTGSLPPVGDIGMPPVRDSVTGAWESIVSSQTATHFPRPELTDLADNYFRVKKIGEIISLQNQTWYELTGTIVGPGRRLDPASEAELRKSLGLARGYARALGNLSASMIRGLNAHDLPYGHSDLDLIADAKQKIVNATSGNEKSAYAVCQPIGAAPPQYGQTTARFATPAILEKSLAFLPGGK